jgi:Phosphotransferase enzyme family
MTGPVATAACFATHWPPVTATPLTHGHIHDTYVITCRNSDGATERVLLQRLNSAVFRDLDALMSNLERITTHLKGQAARRGTRPMIADPIATRAGPPMHTDETGATWRATEFIEHSRVLGSDGTAVELRAAARAFAELTRDLGDLPPPALAETIPAFHDLPGRRAQLAAAITADRAARVSEVGDLIDRAHDLGDRVARELADAGASTLPTRVVHNDAKLDNVLVDPTTGAAVCIVDLDTVMSGTVLSDFGELARTATAAAAEDEPDEASIGVDLDRFRALADGYVRGACSFLMESERACLALAGPLLTLENAVRFLTDHLDGDVYYRVDRPGHNARRARAQLRLAELMVDELGTLRAVIAAVSP